MKGILNLEYPESLANSLKLTGKEFESEIKITSLVKLFELGKVSSGTAAKVLGITRIDFLAKYKVSALGHFDYDDLSEDIANA